VRPCLSPSKEGSPVSLKANGKSWLIIRICSLIRGLYKRPSGARDEHGNLPGFPGPWPAYDGVLCAADVSCGSPQDAGQPPAEVMLDLGSGDDRHDGWEGVIGTFGGPVGQRPGHGRCLGGLLGQPLEDCCEALRFLPVCGRDRLHGINQVGEEVPAVLQQFPGRGTGRLAGAGGCAALPVSSDWFWR
jgi:hypothetical protein